MNAELFAAIGPMLLRGLQVTMKIAVIGILLGFLLGSLSGYALQSKNRVALTVANIYVWIIRGTPIVVQALYVYFVVPALISLAKGEQFTLDPTVAG
ncbi:MAG: ABC transporter permease subunit, partial [Chordicoccus sp.]